MSADGRASSIIGEESLLGIGIYCCLSSLTNDGLGVDDIFALICYYRRPVDKSDFSPLLLMGGSVLFFTGRCGVICCCKSELMVLAAIVVRFYMMAWSLTVRLLSLLFNNLVKSCKMGAY